MINKKNGILAATLVFCLITFVSCKKDLSNQSDITLSSDELRTVTEDDAEADVIFDDVSDQVLGVNGDVGLGSFGQLFGRSPDTTGNGPCFTVTIAPRDLSTFPKTITIDFGTGCLGRDGRVRKGKIITVYTNRLKVNGAEATTTFSNYYVDSVHVEGTHKVKNNSTDSNRIFTRSVTNAKLSKPNGNYIKWNASHTNTQIKGGSTPDFPLDDEFNITGFANGEQLRGTALKTWERLITQPLLKKFTCRWFVSGEVKITRNGNTGTLNFGSGTCDKEATVTVNGVTKTIRLR